MMTKEKIQCRRCGRTIPTDGVHELNGEPYCEECYAERTTTCVCCGEVILREDAEGDNHTQLCGRCFENRYGNCTRCGCLLPMDDFHYLSDEDDDPYCHDCFQAVQNNTVIHPYSYKPEPLFYGTGGRYFGVELEIDEGGMDTDNARELLKIANQGQEHIYIKTDGSLDDGLEIVTHPMTPQYHMETMPWDAVLRRSLDLGYRSHRAGTCGLHVHINRTTFGKARAVQEEHIAHLLYLVEKFWGELLRFSRRTEDSLRRWAARYGLKEHPQEILETAKQGYGGRYVCINLQNRDTVEIRIFRGTLKRNTLLATLQLVNRLCDAANFLSDEELKSYSWVEFVECAREPELIAYLKERRLYLNEPVSVEEDA